MTPEEFRAAAHDMVDWMADYMAGIEDRAVRPEVAPGDILARLPAAPPERGEAMAGIFADFQDIVLPGMTHWQHPSFFAYFPANSSPPSVLAEMLTATLGAQCMSWQTSPAATELEQRVMEWLRDMIGLPVDFTGVIQDTASTATLCALLSARERVTAARANEAGLAEEGALCVYCSSEAHSSVEKAVKIAGMGRANLRLIAVDDAFAMRADALAEAMEADIAAGRQPVAVVAALGSTGSGAIDPLGPIGRVCARHGVWLHVDAAWAGSALILPEQRAMLGGVEYADSFVFNPHKWLFTNFDCSAYFVRDPDALLGALAIQPEYLKTREDAAVHNYRDWGIQLGRRFRALKLWFVIRSYGVEGLRARVAAHIALAEDLAARIEASEDFELLAPRSLALLCLRWHPPGEDDEETLDRLNASLMERINDSGAAYLTHTRLGGRYAIRVSIGQTNTEARHVDALWQQLQDCARKPGPGR
jgi:aromatic-L-amino-acid/L-tryptophan decarboxylase